jgi:hypothetical protein
MKNIKLIFMAILACFVIASVTGCGGGSGSSGNVSSGDGTLRVSVTDAPFPFEYVESASVRIIEVSVRHADGGGFEELPLSGPVDVDLVPLTGGVSEFLVAAELPAGTYDQVRLIVEAGTVVLTDEAVVLDGNTFSTDLGNMKYPSASQSGIKVNIDPNIEVVTQLTADLTLDFDLTKSFVFNGPPTHEPGVKSVLFTPVIRAVNNSEFGSISLTVRGDMGTPEDTLDDELLAGATVRAMDQDGADQAVTATNGSGEAWIQLPPGTYDILIEAEGYETALLEDKAVVLANETPLGEVTLVMTLGEISGTVYSDMSTPGDPGDDNVLAEVIVTIYEAGGTDPLIIDPPGENPLLTDLNGIYRFDNLMPGDYDLKFEKEGFVTQELYTVTAEPAGLAPDVTLEEVIP